MSNSNLDEAMREFDAGNYARARSLMEALSANKEVQLHLAYLYQRGLGGPPANEKAQEMYRALAASGDREGMYFLASSLMEQRVLEESLRYFQMSAELGHVSAAYWSAALYNGLYGYPQDESRYRYFIELAAKLGHVFAQRDIARNDMKNAANLADWATALYRYTRAKISGLCIAVRNPQDLRLR